MNFSYFLNEKTGRFNFIHLSNRTGYKSSVTPHSYQTSFYFENWLSQQVLFSGTVLRGQCSREMSYIQFCKASQARSNGMTQFEQ